MKFTRRILVVATCYLLSSYGLLLSLIIVGRSGTKSLPGALIGLTILFAWIAHLVMSINWTLDRPTEKWVPLYGTLAGTLGLLLWPIAEPSIRTFEFLDIFRSAAMGLLFTLPCFLLAIYLVRFHLGRGFMPSDPQNGFRTAP